MDTDWSNIGYHKTLRNVEFLEDPMDMNTDSKYEEVDLPLIISKIEHS